MIIFNGFTSSSFKFTISLKLFSSGPSRLNNLSWLTLPLLSSSLIIPFSSANASLPSSTILSSISLSLSLSLSASLSLSLSFPSSSTTFASLASNSNLAKPANSLSYSLNASPSSSVSSVSGAFPFPSLTCSACSTSASCSAIASCRLSAFSSGWMLLPSSAVMKDWVEVDMRFRLRWELELSPGKLLCRERLIMFVIRMVRGVRGW